MQDAAPFPRGPAAGGAQDDPGPERLRTAASALRILALFHAGTLAVSLLARAFGPTPAGGLLPELLLGLGWIVALLWLGSELDRGRRLASAAAALVCYGIVGVATRVVLLSPVAARPGAWLLHAPLGILLVAYLFACASVHRALRDDPPQGTTTTPP
ncbi:MAG: hypothetical protein ACT4PV_01260 [Planctomycetaceae bacterium]